MASAESTRWLTVPELVELLGLSVSKVHRLLEEKALLGSRTDGALRVPEEFLRDGEPLPELRGTAILLIDAGFSEDEAVHWLLEEEPLLGTTPIQALRAGRKSEVRRVAQALAF